MLLLKAVTAASLLFTTAQASYGIGGFPGYFKKVKDVPLTFDHWVKDPQPDNWIGIYPVGDPGPRGKYSTAPPPTETAAPPPPAKGARRRGAAEGPTPDGSNAGVWSYAPGTDKFHTLAASSGLAPGDYIAYYVSKNDTWLAPPVTVTVGKTYDARITDVDANGKDQVIVKYETKTAGAAKNWIGIFLELGGGPDNDQAPELRAIVWDYAPEAKGQVTLPKKSLGEGLYKAYILGDDGYKKISPPEIFNVGDAARNPGTLAYEAHGDPWRFFYATRVVDEYNWIGVYKTDGSAPEQQKYVGQALKWVWAPNKVGNVTDISQAALGIPAGTRFRASFDKRDYTFNGKPLDAWM